MAKSSAELSEEFWESARDFAALAQSLSDEEWQAKTEAEGWSAGTVVHHVAQSMGTTWSFTDLIVTDTVPPVSMDDIDTGNASHAEEFADPDRAETMALLQQSTREVATGIEALDHSVLGRSAVVPAFSEEPLSVRNWIEMIVIGHIGMHRSSVEAVKNS